MKKMRQNLQRLTVMKSGNEILTLPSTYTDSELHTFKSTRPRH